MFHRWAALVLVLALCAMSPKNAAGQTQVQSPRGHSAKGKLGVSYPNPFNPDTYLPFTVGDEGCVPGSVQYTVTVQLVNVLGQVVAEPILWEAPGTASTAPAASRGKPIHGMKLTCGSYTGYWDGKVRGREAASGVYGELVFIGDANGANMEALPARKIYYKK